MTVKYLEEYCKKFGPGLDRIHLSTLREVLAIKVLEERRISDGFTYFPTGAGTFGRIMKILDWGRLFLEFNLLPNTHSLSINEDDLVWLDDTDRNTLHAGGVLFCYVGKEINTATKLVIAAIEHRFNMAYESFPKNRLPSIHKSSIVEKVCILIPPGNKKDEVTALLKGFCKKYGVIPVPIEKLMDCLDENNPKVIIAFDLSPQNWSFFPHGFIPISLKELSSRGLMKQISTFDNLKSVARDIFLEKQRK